MSMKSSNDAIGNRTCDLPTCSVVPQPTVPRRIPYRNKYQEYFLGGKGGRCLGLTTSHFHVLTVLKSGSLNLHGPSGPVQACNGIALFYMLSVRQSDWSLRSVKPPEHFLYLFPLQVLNFLPSDVLRKQITARLKWFATIAFTEQTSDPVFKKFSHSDLRNFRISRSMEW
jgi:hypothetical protein